MESVTAPAPLIALPYDEPFRIEPPQIISTLGLMDATAASVTVNYSLPGPGFWDGDTCEAWPAAAQAAFDYAVSIWATQISSSVPVVIEACWASSFTGNILGHGGATGNYYGNMGMPFVDTFYPVALINAVRGNDLMNGAEAEIAVAFNMNYSWYYGTDGNTPSGKIDFVSVVLHEIGHGLGFSGTMRISSGLGSWGWGVSKPGIYDRFTENGAGQGLINTGIFSNSSAVLAAQLTGGSIYFDGQNANAANTANGQGPVKLYAPASWSSGSSYAHLDYDTYRNTENALMVYAIPSQTARHSPGPVMLCLLKDIGWTVPAACDTINLSSFAQSVAHSGGTGNVTLVNGRCCDWTAVSNNASWLNVTSSSSGKGTGSVGFTVDSNPGVAQRTGTITIAGQIFTVTQDGNLPTVAGFDFSPLTSGSVPHNVSFADTSTNATSWAWDFGDGASSTLRNPFHTYQVAGTGTYPVTLTINGGEDSVSHDITVSPDCPNPVARLVIKNVSGSSLLNAYGLVTNDWETIQVQAVEQNGPFTFSGARPVQLEGGYDCEYSVNRLYTVLKGTAAITGSGSVIADNLLVQ
ncbi:MAG: PKD domain-containing protein [Thermodesulfovibrionales bacterium]